MISPDPHRAGFLGHGSILTVSANGIKTSPLTRGVAQGHGLRDLVETIVQNEAFRKR